MNRPRLEVADIVRAAGSRYRRDHASTLTPSQRRVRRASERCRTAALGGHGEQCEACGHQRTADNSCRNRHCPQCQSLAKAQWRDDRRAELLPVEYFPVGFTLPEEMAAIADQNKRVLYNLLFRATAETLRPSAAAPNHLGAERGFIAGLHTWGQPLRYHPPLHWVVPGGGLAPEGQRGGACRPGFFLPVRVLSRLFRRRFLEYRQEAFDPHQLRVCAALEALSASQAVADYGAPVRQRDWVVYAKPPFGGAQQVLDYLGRYTPRVAIAHHR
jgi:hypothetical protein